MPWQTIANLTRFLFAQIGGLPQRARPAAVVMGLICIMLFILRWSVASLLLNDQWAENPLTPHAVTFFNAFLMLALVILGILLIIVLVGVLRQFFRGG